MLANSKFSHLPTTPEEMRLRGWKELDILLITGDAYIDHPSFGIPLIGRLLEKHGYRVGVIAQPNWRDEKDITSLGRPKLFCGISAGAMDSLINKYTANKRPRDYDAYTPGGEPNMRPEKPTIVYTNLVKRAFPGLPTVLGGIEASLRRFTHFDYWNNQVRRSILFDSKADILCHSMGEKTVLEIASHFKSGGTLENMPQIRGTARIYKNLEHLASNAYLELPSHEELLQSKEKFMKTALTIERESNPHNAKILVEKCQDRYVVVQPPQFPLTTKELDEVFELPFSKMPHPKYLQPIPAYEVIKFSITTNRGCFGGCSFCAITLQQGREIQSRSPESIKREVERLKKVQGWSGTITDLGGPSANMYKLKGKDTSICEKCKKMSCLFPEQCFNLDTDHTPQIELLRSVRKIDGVKHVFVNSGIRYDLALNTPEYIKEVSAHHTGGILSVAPEHTDANVLKLMKKPPIEKYNKFVDFFNKFSRDAGKNQHLSPYFISSFPGSDLNKTKEMSQFFQKNNMRPEQIQDFIPSPMTLSTAMYYTELSPSLEPIYVEKQMSKRKLQKRTLQSFLTDERLSKGNKRLFGVGHKPNPPNSKEKTGFSKPSKCGKTKSNRYKNGFPNHYIESETEDIDLQLKPLDING